jgi:hypothetical protein
MRNKDREGRYRPVWIHPHGNPVFQNRSEHFFVKIRRCALMLLRNIQMGAVARRGAYQNSRWVFRYSLAGTGYTLPFTSQWDIIICVYLNQTETESNLVPPQTWPLLAILSVIETKSDRYWCSSRSKLFTYPNVACVDPNKRLKRQKSAICEFHMQILDWSINDQLIRRMSSLFRWLRGSEKAIHRAKWNNRSDA